MSVRVPVNTSPYIIAVGDGYTAYILLAGLIINLAMHLKKEKHRAVDSNGVARCIKIIHAIVMGIFIPRRELRSRGNEFPHRERVETIRTMIITTSESTYVHVYVRLATLYD